jgi:hypothetical protein
MGRARKDMAEQASQEYFSGSTIDRPPQEPKQQSIGGGDAEDESEDDAGDPTKVKIKCVLKIGDHAIPIAIGKCPKDLVEETIFHEIQTTKYIDVLRAVVGDPRTSDYQYSEVGRED